MTKSIFIFLCSLVLWNKGISQEISLDEMIQLGIQDWVEEKPNIPKDIRFPWLDEIDIRTETDEFLLDRQEYTLRLGATTPRIRSAQKALYQHISSQDNFELEKELADKVLQINSDWLYLFLIDKTLLVLEQIEQSYIDRSNIIDQQIESGLVNLEKAQKFYQEQSELKLDQFKLRKEQERIRASYDLGENLPSFTTMPNCLEVITLINEMQITPLPSKDGEFYYEQEKVQREINVERAERNRVFDFIQMQYRGPHDDLFKERFSIGLGLKLDRDVSAVIKLKELEIEKSQLESEQNFEENKSKSVVSAIAAEARALNDEYNFFLGQLNEEKQLLDNLSTVYIQKNGVDPVFLLDLNERKLQLELDAIKYQEQIYEIYLEYLDRSNYFLNSNNKAAF